MELVDNVCYVTWNVNPDIFVIPFIDHPVRWYGVLFAMAFLVSQQIMYFIYRKEGRPVSEIDTLTIYMVVATIVGARLGHVLFYDPIHYFQNPLQIFAVWEGGLASHGGIIGILIALYLFARKTYVPYFWILDRITIVVALSCSIIRLGNLMNSEMIGIPADVPWAFIFSNRDDIPRHPAQLYEAIHYLIACVILYRLWISSRATMANGFLFGWALVILFSMRFTDEFFKINQEQFEDTLFLNMGQILSVPFILAGVVILIVTNRMKRNSFITAEHSMHTEQSKTDWEQRP